jgi:calreticulin
MASRIALFLAVVGIAHCTVFFKETFDDPLDVRWVHSTNKGSDAGKMVLSSGKFFGDEKKDQGMKTSQDAKFYQISTKLAEKFSNEGKSLVLQFSVKHEQSIDCGGGYIKLFPSTLVPESMNGDSPYHVMFGPDICGPGTKRVHVIFTYKEKNHLIKKDIRCKDDELTHLYTLILNSDNTYEVRIDGKKEESGELEADWDMLPAKKIKDPESKKPDDWVDDAKIDDPDDKQPEDWEKPELIPDTEAKKPDDWDDEEDGEWEAPMINNPEYKGEWKAKKIDNPAYKGEWVHPEIDNPEYSADADLYKYDDIGAVGFEIWQVKSGTIFDNIIVTDDVAEAEAFAKETFEATKDAEKKAKDKIDEEDRKKQEEEDKKREAEDKDKKPEADDEEEEEDDEEKEDEDVPKEDDVTEDAAKDEPKDEL